MTAHSPGLPWTKSGLALLIPLITSACISTPRLQGPVLTWSLLSHPPAEETLAKVAAQRPGFDGEHCNIPVAEGLAPRLQATVETGPPAEPADVARLTDHTPVRLTLSDGRSMAFDVSFWPHPALARGLDGVVYSLSDRQKRDVVGMLAEASLASSSCLEARDLFESMLDSAERETAP